MPASADSLGLYIHWPFCASKCPYCDFNSHVAEAVDHDRWRQALLSELSYFANETKTRRLSSIFFGGGTPSLMQPQTTAALIDAAKAHWRPAGDLEVTLEANPSTADANRFEAFRDAGVNRLSLGVQSFRDLNLCFLGRGHSADEAIAAIRLASETFPRFSFDLIYGLPGQTADDWNQDLDQALALARGHLSVYQLGIEPGTAFHRDHVQPAAEETGAVMFEICQQRLSGAGLPAYEISNHAAPGFECRHNLEIWRGGDYVGIGPGAHGHLTDDSVTATIYQIHSPERWLTAVEGNNHGTAKRLALSPDQRGEEILMTGLRLTEGIGRDLAAGLDPVGLKRMLEGGFLVSDDAGVRTTATGKLCLNEVLRQLLVA
ncbi:MAG: radical SAM family heme chaperone HemW [Proteobacteria bacterium]|nr:radical SAM family heme chaperone HemW [Pseudomonadota bacterium]